MEDGKQLQTYGMKEGDFLVLMVTKQTKTTTPATSAAGTSATPDKAPEKKEAPKPTPNTNTNTTNTPSAPSAPQPAAVGSQASFGSGALCTIYYSFDVFDAFHPSFFVQQVVAGEEYNKAVQNLVEMGFPKDQVVAAMRAAFNNPDRAVEYLMTGIPSNPASAASGVAGAATAATPGEDDTEEIELGDVEGEDEEMEVSDELITAFEALRQIPQFDQVRQMILTQPQLMEPLLAQLAQTNPDLVQLIAQNPQAFLAWIATDGGQLASGGMSGTTVVRLTEEENQAVERLAALGFDKNIALQAYLACDKNEMLAANYLFDTAGDYE